MDKDISQYYHYCKAVKLGFDSVKEWGEFCRIHDKEVIAEYKGFQYNSYDQCLNPNVKHFIIPGLQQCAIYTAESEGGWSYGYELAHHFHTMSGIPFYLIPGDKGSSATEKAAIEAAFRRVVIPFCEYDHLDSSVDAVKEAILNLRQLTLFEAI